MSFKIDWKKLGAWWNKIHGFCPECNSSAPELYECPVCKWDTTSPFSKARRRKYLKKWKKLHGYG